MINQPDQNNLRLLAIAPSSKGFGFAIMEGDEFLVDWGVKSLKWDKNTGSTSQVDELMSHYQPEMILLPIEAVETSRRSDRIRFFGQAVSKLAIARRLEVVLISQGEVKSLLFGERKGTKHALAQNLARRFPEELGVRLPRKREIWMSEDYRMDIFEAVALALTFVQRGQQG